MKQQDVAMKQVAMRISKNLYLLMGDKKLWKNTELAAVSGVSVNTISRIKNDHDGNETPSLETVVKLAAAFKVDPRELLK